MSENCKKSILKAGYIVTLCALLAKMIGAAYKIPLINVLGAEGMGIYQLVFPVYAAAIALTSGSAGIIISRNVAKKRANGELEERAGACVLYTMIFSLLAALFLSLFSSLIAKIQGFEQLKNCYFIIAPAVFFVGMSSSLKGIFLGEGKICFSSFCQLLEQLTKAGVGLLLSSLLIKRSLYAAVAGAVAGVTAAETVSFVVCALYYLCGKEKYRLKMRFQRGYLKENSFIILHSLSLPLNALIDGLIAVRLLLFFGNENAAADYGLFSGSVNTLINMPIAVALSFASATIPSISYFYALSSAQNIKESSSKSVKNVLFISCACFFGLFMLSGEMIEILYPSFESGQAERAALLLRICAVNTITAPLCALYVAVLQALDRGNTCLKTSFLCLLLRVIAMIGLCFRAGIVGVALSWVIFYALNMLINCAFHKKLLGRDKELVKNNMKILFCGVIMSLSLILPKILIKDALLKIIICSAAGAGIYCALCFLTGAIGKRREERAVKTRKRSLKWRNSK